MSEKVFAVLLLSAALLISGASMAQGQPESENIMFSNESWVLEKVGDARMGEFLGRQALFLERAQITLADRGFSEGVIEFDLASDYPSGFVGVNFRDDGEGTSEQFYVRFHQSGRPDSTQYLARLNGLASWQIHAGPNDATAVELGTRQWIPIRLVVKGDQADIFVRDLDTPVLHVPLLRSDNADGKISFYAFDRPEMTTGAWFSNIQVRALSERDRIVGKPRDEAPVAEGVFRTWSISSPLSETEFDNQFDLNFLDQEKLEWQQVSVENNGILNIARYVRKTPEKNTVLVRLKVRSTTDTVRQFAFGYSDRVRIYVNGQQQFYGNAQWRSRDHRFLGTISLNDAVPLRLSPGTNEVIAAVSESFGGWGFVGQLVEREDLMIVP